MNKGRPNSEDLRNAAGICVESGVSIDHKNEMFPRLYLVIFNEMQFAAGYYEIKGVIGWITTSDEEVKHLGKYLQRSVNVKRCKENLRKEPPSIHFRNRIKAMVISKLLIESELSHKEQ